MVLTINMIPGLQFVSDPLIMGGKLLKVKRNGIGHDITSGPTSDNPGFREVIQISDQLIFDAIAGDGESVYVLIK